MRELKFKILNTDKRPLESILVGRNSASREDSRLLEQADQTDILEHIAVSLKNIDGHLESIAISQKALADPIRPRSPEAPT